MQWEYKIKTFKASAKSFFNSTRDVQPVEVQMNELGRMGWELVSLELGNQQLMGSSIATAVFKRPK
jgi:hypothetical protein